MSFCVFFVKLYNMEHYFLFFDGEYGGINQPGNNSIPYSILDLNFTVTNVNLEIIESLNLKIKPDNGQYIVNSEALAVNRIDLLSHDKIAVTEGKAKELLYNFLYKHSKNGQIKLIPVGKGIVSDIRVLQEGKIINIGNWRKFVSDQTIDFGGIIMLLKVLNLFPQTESPSSNKFSNSLESLAHHFKIKSSKLHSAEGDVIIYIDVCREIFKLLKKHLPQIKII